MKRPTNKTGNAPPRASFRPAARLALLLTVAITAGITISRPAEGRDYHYDPTYYPTTTAYHYPTPTMYTAPTLQGLLPCTPVPGEPDYGGLNVPTIQFPTVQFGPTSTVTPGPTSTAAPTATAVSPANGKIKLEFNYGSSDVRAVKPYGTLSCVNEAGTRVDVVANGTNPATGTITGYDIQCLAEMSYVRQQDWNYNNIQVGYSFSARANNSGQTVQYWKDVDYQPSYLAGDSDDPSNSVEGYTNGQVVYSPSLNWLYAGRSSADWPGTGTQYIFFRIRTSEFSNNQTTPTPAMTPTATWVPCYEPDYTAPGPIVEWPDLQFTLGGCYTLLPGFTLPLPNGDLEIVGVQVCVTYIDTQIVFMGWNVDAMITLFVVLGMAFAVINEFRS